MQKEANHEYSIGDYYFEYANQGEYEKNEEEIMRMMAKYFEFYGQFQKENEYVTSGSLLWCTRGSKLTKFDVPIDHSNSMSANRKNL